MRLWLFWVLAIVPAHSLAIDSPAFEFVGQFSNMTYSQDHQGGEDVYLWRERNDLHGYIEYSLGGALGDTTTARLENIRFDAATRKLSFQARNPLYDEKGNVIRNLFVFDGVIGPGAIAGVLQCRDAVTNERCWNDKKVSWKKGKRHAEMYRLRSRQEWEAHLNEQLKLRGARW